MVVIERRAGQIRALDYDVVLDMSCDDAKRVDRDAIAVLDDLDAAGIVDPQIMSGTRSE